MHDSIWGSSAYQIDAHDAPLSNSTIDQVSDAFREKYGISEAEARRLPVGWHGTLVDEEIPNSVRKYIPRS